MKWPLVWLDSLCIDYLVWRGQYHRLMPDEGVRFYEEDAEVTNTSKDKAVWIAVYCIETLEDSDDTRR